MRHLIWALVLLFVPTLATADDARIVVDWNRTILEVAEAEDRFLTLKGVRTAAMAHAAMHDALNSIEARYEGLTRAHPTPNADPRAAAAQAAYTVAVDQYPDQQARFGELLASQLGGATLGAARDRGIALGRDVAKQVLDSREGDGWDGEAEYQWHPMGPGVYAEFNEHSGTPEGFILGAGWAEAKPFLLDRADHFRAPPPPEIASDAYTAAFDEVKEVGRHESETRTADQTHLAMWWKDFVENSHNRLARDLVVREELDLWKATRLFALLNISVFDAYVCVFENKFHYNHWRPYTAIRWADHDGNPATEVDEHWDNLHRHTYPFPSYPSAHGCASTAAMTVLADTFGDDYAFTMTTRFVDRDGPLSDKIEMDPPTRSFESFSEAGMECAMSRVYLGIHFRYDSEEGFELGRKIGEHAVNGFSRKVVVEGRR